MQRGWRHSRPVNGGVPRLDAAIEPKEQIMHARHSRPQFRLTALAMIAFACAATVLSASDSKSGGSRSGTYAVRDDDTDLMLRIENSTFPAPPRGSETSPWRG
jgi:hypothetical protein